MRVLAVAAHPDDLEILCAGTLRRCVERGDEVTMAHVSRGDAGSFTQAPDEIAAIRAAEAASAAAVVGAEYVGLTESDGAVNAADEDQRRAMVRLIRDTRPDLVITHAANDYMPDHNEVSKLVFDATFTATLPNYAGDHPAHDRVPVLYHMDTLTGVGFTPTDYVDISDTFAVKTKALAMHESQLRWLDEHDGVDTLEMIDIVGRFRGLQCGVRHAEAFAVQHTWLRASPRRLLP
ncbi:PIG-L deacetylase family protein [Jiangella alba]|uniref:N-acetylglucosaminyl deacetylase, LmbE family n=1 Tax=Jiangella alba TaxID=561176 RepID=A0A1H5PWF4_9ACTN|nr:PIG-L deacetylase family protein [Jiangella alba]SEF17984.1 N-acetylglucosaminyl deacetylase, LmbE family [Jiangella alba]